MKVGILPGRLTDARSLGRFAANVEAAGFDSLWMGDHVAFPAPILDTFQVLSCFASHTTRITLGTCVYLIPLRHPTTIAKATASFDFLSGGRFVFGVGVGGEFQREFEACGIPVNERGGRANEAIEIAQRLWRQEPGAYRGRYFDVPEVTLAPRPARTGGPPIWVGGRAEAALQRTARYGDGYVGYLLTPEGFRTRMERIRELAKNNERNVNFQGALLCFSYIDPDRDAALERVARTLGSIYGRDMKSASSRYAIAGSPDDARRRIAEYREAGVEHLIFAPMAGGDELTAQIERLNQLLTIP